MRIVMEDFNAKAGREKVDGYVWEFGQGDRNEREDRLVDFYQSENFVVKSTMSQLSKEHIVRNQIKYILIKNKHTLIAY